MPPGSFSVLTQADLYWWFTGPIQTGDSPDKATAQLNANASKLEQSSTRPAAVTARNPLDTKSWLRERAILQTTLPVTGEILSKHFPDFGATHGPPMKLS